MPESLKDALEAFCTENKFRGKGPLCVALVVTQHARDKGLPLDADTLLTEGRGQVSGLSRANVQEVLQRHGIEKVLAAEGGRTSRGSIGNMRYYVEFLNGLHAEGVVDLDAVEGYWAGRVREFFAADPLSIRLDSARSLRTVIADVLTQAAERQAGTTGMQYEGAVLQHLVGAKLDCALNGITIEHNSFSTADAPLGPPGDFHVGDVAIHVTTAPSDALMERCQENLDSGHRPVVITVPYRATTAKDLAEDKGILARLDIFDIEQFVAMNLYEWAGFEQGKRRVAVDSLVKRCNEIVEKCETDPSLRIAIK